MINFIITINNLLMSSKVGDFPKKKSEAEQELERMFGSEDEQSLDLIGR